MQPHRTDRVLPAVVWALGVTQVIGYGSLYYAFGVLAPDIAAEFGWPREWLYGALTAALLVGALVAPIAGSLSDSIGAARVMTFGSLGAAASLAICALASNAVVFLLGLVAIEIASAFVLYSTAFAAMAQLSERGSRQAITHLTLIAGFASSIFWPLTSFLNAGVSWQTVYLIYAGVNLAVCLPLHLWVSAHTKRSRLSKPLDAPPPLAPLARPGSESAALLLMLAAFALKGFVSSAVLVHLVPTLSELGMGAQGAIVAAVFGPAQVIGRLLNMWFGRNLSQVALAVFSALSMPVGVFVLSLFAPSFAGALVFAVLFGLGSGLGSIVSGTLPLALFGSSGYGRRLGMLSAATLLSSAFAPFLFSLVASATNPRVALVFGAVVGMGAVLAFAAIWWTILPVANPPLDEPKLSPETP